MKGRVNFYVLRFLSALIISLAAQFTTSLAQPSARSDIAVGKVIDKVVCAADLDQSYALYLPSRYTAERSWPILLALDPAAQGKIPVEHFKAAAEQYGWIVAASNNSRNGPVEQSVAAVNAIWRDTHARFSIDDRRVYLAGFSGAGRAAVAIAAACNQCAAGVISGGAGFPTGLAPSAIRFAIFTTIGVDDFNFPEVIELDNALAKAGAAHHVRVFSGAHEWASSDVLIEAVEWMELNAMRAGTRPREEKLIDALWRKQLARSESLEAAGQLYEAHQTLARAAASFNSLRDIREAEKRIAALASRRELKEQQRSEQQQIKKQRDLEAQVYRLTAATNGNAEVSGSDNEHFSESSPTSARVKLRSMLAGFRKAADSAQDSDEGRVARRVMSGLWVGFFEQGLNLLERQKRYAAAARVFELVTEVAPERPGGYYFLAVAHAANREKKKSLAALKTAIEKGFADVEAIKKNEAFASIRNERVYQELIDRLSGAQ